MNIHVTKSKNKYLNNHDSTIHAKKTGEVFIYGLRITVNLASNWLTNSNLNEIPNKFFSFTFSFLLWERNVVKCILCVIQLEFINIKMTIVYTVNGESNTYFSIALHFEIQNVNLHVSNPTKSKHLILLLCKNE